MHLFCRSRAEKTKNEAETDCREGVFETSAAALDRLTESDPPITIPPRLIEGPKRLGTRIGGPCTAEPQSLSGLDSCHRRRVGCLPPGWFAGTRRTWSR